MSEYKQRQMDMSQAAAFPLGAQDRTAFLEALVALAAEHELTYLLAYHDDGVVWGRFNDGRWALSSDHFEVSPAFRTRTLQECRVFGQNAELLVWREGQQLHGSLLREGQGSSLLCFERHYLLWGDSIADRQDGFTLLREGAEGLYHAVPLANARPRAALVIRHYVDYDAQNQAYIKWSRLVDLVDDRS